MVASTTISDVRKALASLSSAVASKKKPPVTEVNRSLTLLEIERPGVHVVNKIGPLLRAPMLPLYREHGVHAYKYCSAVLDFLFSVRIPAAARDNDTASVKAWEDVQVSLLLGVLDLVEENPSESVKTDIANSLYTIIAQHCFLYPVDGRQTLGAKLLGTAYAILTDTAEKHTDNRRKLRNAGILGGERFGITLARCEALLVLDPLLELFATILPPTSAQDKRREFVEATFDPAHHPSAEALRKIFLSSAILEWEVVCAELVKTLAASNHKFPQPFFVNSLSVGGRELNVGNRLYLDRTGLVANIEDSNGDVDAFLVPTSTVTEIHLTSARNDSIKILTAALSDAPKIGDAQKKAAKATEMVIELLQSEVAKFTEALKSKGLAVKGPVHSRKVSKLAEDLQLDFDSRGLPYKEKVDIVMSQMTPSPVHVNVPLSPLTPDPETRIHSRAPSPLALPKSKAKGSEDAPSVSSAVGKQDVPPPVSGNLKGHLLDETLFDDGAKPQQAKVIDLSDDSNDCEPPKANKASAAQSKLLPRRAKPSGKDDVPRPKSAVKDNQAEKEVQKKIKTGEEKKKLPATTKTAAVKATAKPTKRKRDLHEDEEDRQDDAPPAAKRRKAKDPVFDKVAQPAKRAYGRKARQSSPPPAQPPSIQSEPEDSIESCSSPPPRPVAKATARENRVRGRTKAKKDMIDKAKPKETTVRRSARAKKVAEPVPKPQETVPSPSVNSKPSDPASPLPKTTARASNVDVDVLTKGEKKFDSPSNEPQAGSFSSPPAASKKEVVHTKPKARALKKTPPVEAASPEHMPDMNLSPLAGVKATSKSKTQRTIAPSSEAPFEKKSARPTRKVIPSELQAKAASSEFARPKRFPNTIVPLTEDSEEKDKQKVEPKQNVVTRIASKAEPAVSTFASRARTPSPELMDVDPVILPASIQRPPAYKKIAMPKDSTSPIIDLTQEESPKKKVAHARLGLNLKLPLANQDASLDESPSNAALIRSKSRSVRPLAHDTNSVPLPSSTRPASAAPQNRQPSVIDLSLDEDNTIVVDPPLVRKLAPLRLQEIKKLSSKDLMPPPSSNTNLREKLPVPLLDAPRTESPSVDRQEDTPARRTARFKFAESTPANRNGARGLSLFEDVDEPESEASEVSEIVEVLNDIREVIVQRISRKFDGVRQEVRVGKQSILNDAAAELEVMRSASVAHFNALIDLESEYATYERELADGFHAIALVNTQAAGSLKDLMQQLDRQSLSKRAPADLPPFVF
ncbi:hypothetical protein CYLTODRAFT_453299 [Cylindrobasidium torrendii FP15055 ss-10]|uniref:Uncharacterized protein n=1 Tax=Cylindrobasidium torrendii FP15055 ss-10 TaxID=1314674 RepID=A0A0D7BE44_9AGAR|nr:hypothetical protein CYLTODRAFT_453299 [Cylindrobasidium torrendii FP15055 ss-10]